MPPGQRRIIVPERYGDKSEILALSAFRTTTVRPTREKNGS
jgi:hypothetical protein